jgi:hypothetical protein
MSICLSRYAIQESKKIPIIVHPMNTSSCGMFLELLSFSLISMSLDPSKIFLCPSGSKRFTITARCFMFTHYVRKHSARGGIYRNANSLNRHWVSDCGTQSEERNTKCCLSVASSLSDLKNLCSGLRAQDVFAPFFVSFLSVTKEMKNFCIVSRKRRIPLLKNIKILVIIPLCAKKVLYLHSNFEK